MSVFKIASGHSADAAAAAAAVTSLDNFPSLSSDVIAQPLIRPAAYDARALKANSGFYTEGMPRCWVELMVSYADKKVLFDALVDNADSGDVTIYVHDRFKQWAYYNAVLEWPDESDEDPQDAEFLWGFELTRLKLAFVALEELS